MALRVWDGKRFSWEGSGIRRLRGAEGKEEGEKLLRLRPFFDWKSRGRSINGVNELKNLEDEGVKKEVFLGIRDRKGANLTRGES